MRLRSIDCYKKKRRPNLELLEGRHLLASDVLITEFVASNDSTLDDSDGDSSDWLELFNDSNVPIDLGGWHLTDDPNELDKWTLPTLMINPREFVVVFASGKDRAIAGSELHTNFKLSRDGEFLALVEPDRRTISHEYSPFPQQFTDVSYGLHSESVVSELVGPGSGSRVLLPTSSTDVSADVWSSPGFDDSSWQTRNAGLGFSDGSFDSLIHGDGDIGEMRGTSASAYIRMPFQISDPVASYDALELTVDYDDGFAAYLNGTKIATSNAPNVLDADSTAMPEQDTAGSSLAYENLAGTEELTLVGDADWGPNSLRLTGSERSESGATWTTDPLTFGPNFSFSAFMQIDITKPGGVGDSDGPGGHGMAFVLQSGGQFRLGESGGALGLDSSGMQFVAVEFDSWSGGSFDPNDDLPSHIGINSSVVGNIARVAVPRFNGSGESDPRYAWIDYDGVTNQLDVFFSDIEVKPGNETLSATVDLQSIFEDSTSLWAGWTAANGAETWNTHEVKDFTITTSGNAAFKSEAIDLSNFVHELRPGENVLAIHGLNASVDDADFLIRPTLNVTQNNRFELDTAGYFNVPTPGEPNAESTEAPSGIVTYSVAGRTFAEPFDVAITAESADAEIRYTLDGSIPDEESELYTEPIRVETSMRIRARSFEPGKAAGPLNSQGYIAIGPDLTDFEGGVFESNLPLMVFHSFGGRVHSNVSRLVPVSSVFINNTDGSASLLGEPEFAGRAGLRTRGQSSQGWPKKQYALELWKEGNSDTRPIRASDGDDRSVSVLGLPAESDWVLNGPYTDKTQINNYLTFTWSNAMGQYAPRTRLVEVFVKTNEGALNYRTDYRGTYVLLEKIKIDARRVNITELSPGAAEEPEISGGYIWKYDKDGAGDVNFRTSFQSRAGSGRPWKFVEPQRPPEVQRDWLKDHLTEFETALYGPDFDDPVEGYAKYIDVDSWVNTWLLVEFTKNIDGFRLSTYYHKDVEGKITQGPAWDFNLSLSNANYLQGAYPAGWYHESLSRADYPYWDRLFEDPNFEMRVRDRWFELRNTIFSTENLLSDIDEAVGLLTDGNPNLGDPGPGEPSNPISRNFDRWGTLGSYLWPNCFFGTGTCPTSPLPNRGRPDSYEDYIFILKDFVERRAEWIDQQFRLPPTITPAGGIVRPQVKVAIAPTSAGRVYFTLDGSDPRDHLTGGVSNSAIEYEEPFTLTENVIVQSRTLRGRTWSGKASQAYYVEIPTITISELNYNPSEPSASERVAGYTDNEHFEFFELVNFGTEPVSLENTRFTEGIDVSLDSEIVSPAERVVVVQNKDAFRFRYGDELRIVGEYGSLDSNLDSRLRNSGEQLVMIGALGEPIIDLSYSDTWYPLTDGDGFSLVRREPIIASSENEAIVWRPSEFVGGSPGTSESGAVPDPGAVVINEVRRSSGSMRDVVELLNRTNQAISIGGFLLSDDVNTEPKSRIPDGVQIPANGFIQLDERQLGGGFRIDPRGGQLILRGALDDGTLTGFVEIVEYGASGTGQSWGRYETSVSSDFAPTSAVTLGAANAPPQIGPVVINEIQYHPMPGGREFIELHNISQESVQISGWEFDRGIRYRFPTGAEIPAGGYVVLLQIGEPNDSAVEALRQEYSIPEDVAAFTYSPADASLSNGGEALVLKRPAPNGSQMIEVDRIVYSDEAPWNARADGFGPSLSRIVADAYGNDPANWKSSTIGGTPGRDNVFEDATPPSTPQNLAARVLENGEIALAWSPSVDLDSEVQQYAVYRNGKQIASTPIPFFRDHVTWTEGRPPSYHVASLNPDGFHSDGSNVVRVDGEAISFQHGVARYNGASDAEIQSSDPDENNADARRVRFDGNDEGGESEAASSLFRWSKISIPTDSRIVGASISLNVLNPGDDYEIKPVHRAWVEGEVTWNQAADGNPWQQPGAQGEDDVGSRIGVIKTSGRESVTTPLNRIGVEVVQEWLVDPESNHGVIFANPGESTDSVFVDASETRTRELRPKLTIFHVPKAENIVGDLNLDGVADSADIDLIHAALREEIDDLHLDLDGNESVEAADVDFLLASILGTTRGDADLNGVVEFADFLLLAAAFPENEQQGWESGDFNGDGRTTFADFLLLAANFGPA